MGTPLVEVNKNRFMKKNQTYAHLPKLKTKSKVVFRKLTKNNFFSIFNILYSISKFMRLGTHV